MAIWILYSTEARSDLMAIDLLLILYTVAKLNLLDLRSIMGCPGALAQYLHALFGQKENFNVYFSKKVIIITSKCGTTIFFSHYNPFLGKLKEKLARKARVNTDVNVSDRAHAPWVSHNTP